MTRMPTQLPSRRSSTSCSPCRSWSRTVIWSDGPERRLARSPETWKRSPVSARAGLANSASPAASHQTLWCLCAVMVASVVRYIGMPEEHAATRAGSRPAWPRRRPGECDTFRSLTLFIGRRPEEVDGAQRKEDEDGKRRPLEPEVMPVAQHVDGEEEEDERAGAGGADVDVGEALV